MIRLGTSLLFLSACTPCVGDIEVLQGSTQPPPESTVQLQYVFDGQVAAGPDDCGLFWEVDGTGQADVGTIDDCGLYTAPPSGSAQVVTVVASHELRGTCFDCCPHASIDLTLVPVPE